VQFDVEAVLKALQARETGDTQRESCWNVCCGRGGGEVVRDQPIDARLHDQEASPLISAAPKSKVSMIIVVSTPVPSPHREPLSPDPHDPPPTEYGREGIVAKGHYYVTLTDAQRAHRFAFTQPEGVPPRRLIRAQSLLHADAQLSTTAIGKARDVPATALEVAQEGNPHWLRGRSLFSWLSHAAHPPPAETRGQASCLPTPWSNAGLWSPTPLRWCGAR
jgi:hypothetical protein